MAKTCRWCKEVSLQAICANCNSEIIINHNSIDCCWVHRVGGIICNTANLGMQAKPIPDSIEPSKTNDIPKPVNYKTYPVAVLATTKRSGKTYAEALGIKNYRVVTSRNEIEGLRVRAVVITPRYLAKMETVMYDAGENIRIAMRMAALTRAPMG